MYLIFGISINATSMDDSYELWINLTNAALTLLKDLSPESVKMPSFYNILPVGNEPNVTQSHYSTFGKRGPNTATFTHAIISVIDGSDIIT